jgi:hypothetical protein
MHGRGGEDHRPGPAAKPGNERGRIQRRRREEVGQGAERAVRRESEPGRQARRGRADRRRRPRPSRHRPNGDQQAEPQQAPVTGQVQRRAELLLQTTPAVARKHRTTVERASPRVVGRAESRLLTLVPIDDIRAASGARPGPDDGSFRLRPIGGRPGLART